jgi:hypothetical protein
VCKQVVEVVKEWVKEEEEVGVRRRRDAFWQ